MHNDYDTWRQSTVLADCLRELGFDDLAKDALQGKGETVDKYLSIIIKEANKRRNTDIFDRLYFSGLTYGHGGL